MTTMRLPIDPETKQAAKVAAKRDGMTFAGWWIRLGRRALGLSDEVPVPENQTSTPATPLADVEVSEVKSSGAESGVSEMNLESRLRASVDMVALKRKGGKL